MNKACKLEDAIAPEPYVTKVPMLVRSKDKESTEMVDHSFLLPTDWLASASKDKGAMDAVFNIGQVCTFWNNHRSDDPKLYNNPVTQVSNYKAKMVPMLLHGDGGQFQRRDSLNVISLQSLLSKANAYLKFMLLTAVPKRCTAVDKTNPVHDTMTAIWEVLVWNLNFAFQGIHPATDHKGNPWPRGSPRAKLAGKRLYESYGLWIFGINPDLEYMQNQFKLKCHSFANCCWICPANKSDVPYTDSSPFAKWRRLVYTVMQNRENPATSHQVMNIRGVVNETFCFETLHTNELGVTVNYIGNVFWDQVYDRYAEGATLATRLSNLWKSVMEKYTEFKVQSSDRIGKLTLEMFADPAAPRQSYPVLSQCKAYHVKCLLPIAVSLCTDHHEKEPSTYMEHCCRAGESLCDMNKIMQSAGMHPNREERINFRKAVDTFQVHYAALAADSQVRGLKKWNTTPKFHYNAHSPDFFDYLNVYYTSAYGAETEVGIICALGHRCLDGTPAHRVSKKLVLKYRLGQHIRLSNKYDIDVEAHLLALD